MGDERDWDQQRGLKKRPASSVSERNGKIWHSLVEIFGVRWVNSYGDKPGKIWCQLFDALNDEQIHQGIAHFANEDREHPPPMGNFKAVCLMHTPTSLDALPEPDYDKWHKGGQKVMLRIVMARGGVSDKMRDKLIAEKNRIVGQYRVMDEDKEVEVDWKEFIDVLDARLETMVKDSPIR